MPYFLVNLFPRQLVNFPKHCCGFFGRNRYLCDMWKEKLGNYLIDISKYLLTGVFIASMFKDLEDVKWLVYGLSLAVAAALLVIGLVLNNKKELEDRT